jgi:hypothetical protein
MDGSNSHGEGAGMPKTTGFALGSQVGMTREPRIEALSRTSYAAMTLLQSVYIGGGGLVIVESTA